jgi:hypothetical protein
MKWRTELIFVSSGYEELPRNQGQSNIPPDDFIGMGVSWITPVTKSQDGNIAERLSNLVRPHTELCPVHNNSTRNCDASAQLNQRLATDKSCSSNI